MAIYHLSAKPISRAQGRSATGAAAYRAGVEITDERTGLVHDYTRKGGVLHSELILPGGETADRAEFWNGIEAHHKRGDAVLVREVEISLPTELMPEQRQALAVGYARELADRYGVAADVALHAPRTVTDRDLEKNPDQYHETDPDTGRRHNGNWHAHIMLSACHVAPDGTLGKKAVELDPIHCQRAKIENMAERERARWGELANAALERHGHEARIDHRSHAARGIEAEPTQHLGPAATGYERRTGEPSRKRQDFDQEVAERLTRAREAGELERRGQAFDRAIINTTGDLRAALRERDQLQAEQANLERQTTLMRAAREAEEARKRAVEVSVRGGYTKALDRVTSETLATLPGLLPPEAVRQALHQVGQEVKAEAQQADYQVKAVDLDAIRRQVESQPAQQRRLEWARDMDKTARDKLESAASMGVLKRIVYDTKAMTADAQRLQRAAERERAEVKDAVEQSPELREGRRQQAEGEQRLLSASYTLKALGEMQARSECGQALWQCPKHVTRVPETVSRVVEAARAAAPTAVQSMPLAEVQRMAERAAEVAWTPRAGNEIEVAKSRFVLPAEERRRQQLEREAKAQQKGRGR